MREQNEGNQEDTHKHRKTGGSPRTNRAGKTQKQSKAKPNGKNNKNTPSSNQRQLVEKLVPTALPGKLLLVQPTPNLDSETNKEQSENGAWCTNSLREQTRGRPRTQTKTQGDRGLPQNNRADATHEQTRTKPKAKAKNAKQQAKSD